MSDEFGNACADALREMQEYLHHELPAADAASVRAHLEHCESCRAELRVNEKLREIVQRSCCDKAPESLRAHVLAALRTND